MYHRKPHKTWNFVYKICSHTRSWDDGSDILQSTHNFKQKQYRQL